MAITRHRIERWPLDRLRPSRGNPRKHPAHQLDMIAASIVRFGWTMPILASEEGEIIVGEGAYLAAQKLGLADVPVIPTGELTPEEIDAYRIADNRIAQESTWDWDILKDVAAGLSLDLTLLGLSDPEILRIRGRSNEPGPVVQPPAPAEPISQLGDLWVLGEHRVLCGDSTSGDDVAMLMADGSGDLAFPSELAAARERKRASAGGDMVAGRAAQVVVFDGSAELVFTDPPYGMSFGGGRAMGSTPIGAKVKAHGTIRGADLVQLVSAALKNARRVSRDDAAFYVCLTWRTYSAFEAAMAEAGLSIDACIVWDKESIGLGQQHYRPQHEFIFYSAGNTWVAGKVESDVWHHPRAATSAYVHPTQKPLTLIERAIANSSRQGGVVLDLFGGSGSTLMAADRMKRRARLMELDPKYVDAICLRWQDATGRAAVLMPSGRSFDAVRSERALSAA